MEYNSASTKPEINELEKRSPPKVGGQAIAPPELSRQSVSKC